MNPASDEAALPPVIGVPSRIAFPPLCDEAW